MAGVENKLKTEKRAYAVVRGGPIGLLADGGPNNYTALSDAGFAPGDQVEIRLREAPGEVVPSPWRAPTTGYELHELLVAARDRIKGPFESLRADLAAAVEYFRAEYLRALAAAPEGPRLTKVHAPGVGDNDGYFVLTRAAPEGQEVAGCLVAVPCGRGLPCATHPEPGQEAPRDHLKTFSVCGNCEQTYCEHLPIDHCPMCGENGCLTDHTGPCTFPDESDFEGWCFLHRDDYPEKAPPPITDLMAAMKESLARKEAERAAQQEAPSALPAQVVCVHPVHPDKPHDVVAGGFKCIDPRPAHPPVSAAPVEQKQLGEEGVKAITASTIGPDPHTPDTRPTLHPCGHGRADYRGCPHCMGFNQRPMDGAMPAFTVSYASVGQIIPPTDPRFSAILARDRQWTEALDGACNDCLRRAARWPVELLQGEEWTDCEHCGTALRDLVTGEEPPSNSLPVETRGSAPDETGHPGVLSDGDYCGCDKHQEMVRRGLLIRAAVSTKKETP